MRDVLLPLFETHRIPTPMAIWTTDQSNTAPVMTWILQWPNLEERNAAWAGFRPIWEATKKRSQEEEFVTRTDLTLIDPWPDRPLTFARGNALCESAWVVQPQIGLGGSFRSICHDHEFARFAQLGAVGVAASDFMFGPLPQSLVILSWPNEDVRLSGLLEIQKSYLTQEKRKEEVLVSPGLWTPLTRVPYLDTWRES